MSQQASSTSYHPGGSLRSRLNSALSGLSDQLGSKLPEINSIQHTIRQQVVTHSPNQAPETLKLQLAITAGAAVVRDEDALSREQLASSKAFFLWGQSQTQAPEIVDVTDRMAYLQYVTGELYASHARSLEQSRMLLKDIRHLENDLLPRRRNHASLQAKLTALETSTKPKDKDPAALAALRAELLESAQELETFEASLAAVRRSKLRESARVQYAAQKELGEKLAIVGAWGEVLSEALEGMERGEGYAGQSKTAGVRAGVAEALGSWSSERSYVPRPVLGGTGSESLRRQDTRSFGSTHASELSRVSTQTDSSPAQPSVSGQGPLATASDSSSAYHSAAAEHPSRTSSLAASNAATPPTLPPRQPSPAPSHSADPFVDHSSPPTHPALSSDHVAPAPAPDAAANPWTDATAGSSASGGLGRMGTTDRRRLEHAEAEIGDAVGGEGRVGDQLPTYTLMDEELTVEERERRQAEETEARAREAKRTGRDGLYEGR